MLPSIEWRCQQLTLCAWNWSSSIQRWNVPCTAAHRFWYVWNIHHVLPCMVLGWLGNVPCMDVHAKTSCTATPLFSLFHIMSVHATAYLLIAWSDSCLNCMSVVVDHATLPHGTMNKRQILENIRDWQKTPAPEVNKRRLYARLASSDGEAEREKRQKIDKKGAMNTLLLVAFNGREWTESMAGPGLGNKSLNTGAQMSRYLVIDLKLRSFTHIKLHR